MSAFEFARHGRKGKKKGVSKAAAQGRNVVNLNPFFAETVDSDDDPVSPRSDPDGAQPGSPRSPVHTNPMFAMEAAFDEESPSFAYSLPVHSC